MDFIESGSSERLSSTGGAGVRVLVVEDNPEIGEFTTHSLTELGFTTTLAPDGAAALLILQHNPGALDVVFSDVVMPGMSGIELGEAIREDHFGLPVILAPGYSHALATHGASGFELIHKPYSIEQVARSLVAAAALG